MQQVAEMSLAFFHPGDLTLFNRVMIVLVVVVLPLVVIGLLINGSRGDDT